jgi:hypothetical protein
MSELRRVSGLLRKIWIFLDGLEDFELGGSLFVERLDVSGSPARIRESHPVVQERDMVDISSIALTTQDYLYNSPNGYDTFVLRVTGATVNGTAVDIPGLNSKFGLYIEGTVAVSGNPSVYGPGTIALLLDPTNNDGSLSATFNSSTQTGSVNFSNPSGTGDDTTLASGQFVSGVFGTQSNGQPGLQLVNTFNPDAALSKLLHGAALDIQTQLFNTATSRQPGTTDSGQMYVLVNDGDGIATLASASGSTTSDNVPLRQIFADLDDLKFIGGGHHARHC